MDTADKERAQTVPALRGGTKQDAVDFVRGRGIEAEGFDAIDDGHIPGVWLVFALGGRAGPRSFIVDLSAGRMAEAANTGFLAAPPRAAGLPWHPAGEQEPIHTLS